LGTIQVFLENLCNKTQRFSGNFQKATDIKAIESSVNLERAMGIEQIRMNQTQALPPAFQFNWSQMESDLA